MALEVVRRREKTRMLLIDRTYEGTLSQVFSDEPVPPCPDDPSQRLQKAGICIMECKIVAPDGSAIQDVIVLECAKQFATATFKARGDALEREMVRKDILDLCAKIAEKKLQVAGATSQTSNKIIEPLAQPPAATETSSAGPTEPEAAPSPQSAHSASAQALPVPPDLSESKNEPQSGESTASAAPASPAQPPSALPAISPTTVRKPATWQDNKVTAPWCPETIQPILGFEVAYEDNYQRDSAASPGWHIVAATHRGRMHAHHGTHREDAFDFYTDKEFTIVCVSDGAGAYQYSRIGSESTSRKVVSALAAALDSRRAELQKLSPADFNIQIQNVIRETVQGACTFLHDLAAKTDTKPKDFRCTLVLGILWLAGETPLLVFSQVGDGFMAGQKKDGEAQRYGKSDSGALSGEVNCFIPDADAVHNAQNVVVIGAANADAFIFCSDGIEDPFYPTEKKSQAIFQQLREGVSEPISGFEKQKPHGPVIGSPDAKARLASWLDFEKKGENDDRTILILHRSPSQLAAPAEAAEVKATAQSPADDAPPAAAKPE